MFDALSRYQPHLLGLLRIVAGLLFLAHGVVKLFGFPPGAMICAVEYVKRALWPVDWRV